MLLFEIYLAYSLKFLKPLLRNAALKPISVFGVYSYFECGLQLGWQCSWSEGSGPALAAVTSLSVGPWLNFRIGQADLFCRWDGFLKWAAALHNTGLGHFTAHCLEFL